MKKTSKIIALCSLFVLACIMAQAQPGPGIQSGGGAVTGGPIGGGAPIEGGLSMLLLLALLFGVYKFYHTRRVASITE
ncbi:MAG: hypothetical protein ACOYMF_07815 [Bacteroidales bacterium]